VQKRKQSSKTVITKAEDDRKTAFNEKTALNWMSVYDINEPWVQQYIEDFGCEPSFF